VFSVVRTDAEKTDHPSYDGTYHDQQSTPIDESNARFALRITDTEERAGE